MLSPSARSARVCKGISCNAFPLWSECVVLDVFFVMIKPPKAPPIYPPEDPGQNGDNSNFVPPITISLWTIIFGPWQNSRLTESESQGREKGKEENWLKSIDDFAGSLIHRFFSNNISENILNLRKHYYYLVLVMHFLSPTVQTRKWLLSLKNIVIIWNDSIRLKNTCFT